jgi:hypothetical protein
MNHVHNFDGFLNEANISFYKSTVVAALRELGYDVKQSDLKIGAKSKGSYDLITLNGESLCSSSQYDEMVKWIKNAVTEDPKKYDLDPRVLETIDTKYWAGYNTDTSGQGKKEFANKSNDFEETFEDAVVAWNQEAEKDAMIKGAQIQKIRNLAQEFFKKEKWISVNVIHAMISQES